METTTAPMSAPSRPGPAGEAGTAPAVRRVQPRLLLAAAGVLVGSFLPWVDTVAGSLSGMAGPGVWTFYAGVLLLAGGLLRRPRLAAVHAAVGGIACVVLPVWQGLRLVSACGGGTCVPATGLFLVLGAGLFALWQVRRLWRIAPGRG